jgi:acyl carrier protein
VTRPERQDIQEQILTYIAQHFELDPARVTLEAKFVADLGLDSLDAVELLLHLHEMTGKKIDEEEIRKVVTIGDIVDLVVRLNEEQGAGAAAAATQ